MNPLKTLFTSTLCLTLFPMTTWAAEDAAQQAAKEALSQGERERIVRALVEGDDKNSTSFQDVALPQNTAEPVLQLKAQTNTPAVPSRDSEKSNMFEVSRRDAEASISVALAAQGAAELIEADITKPSNNVLYKHNKPLKIEIKTLQFDTTTHLWSANLLLTDDMGAVVTAMPASGRWQEMKSVPSLKHTVRAGETITEADIEQIAYPVGRLHDDNVLDASELVGMTPRRSISNNRPVRKNEVQAPAIVKKGATVTMRFNTPAMSISTVGQTLQAGGKGEMIRVKNMDSNAIVQATVLSENEVQVGGADGANSNAQGVILSPAKDITTRAGTETPVPLKADPASPPLPQAPSAQMTPEQEKFAAPVMPVQPSPAAATHTLPQSPVPAQLQAPIPIRPEQAKQTAADDAQKQALKEKMVRDAFMEGEGMTPTKVLEELNPDDMILAPRKMLSSPELPELDPTKPNIPANPFQGMTK